MCGKSLAVTHCKSLSVCVLAYVHVCARVCVYVCVCVCRLGSVNRDTLWSILQHSYNLPGKLLSIICVLHEDSLAAVRAYGQTSEEFAVTSGVCQGCVLAPTLFNLYFDVVIRMALEDHRLQGSGVRVACLHNANLVGNWRKLHLESIIADLEYVDDMALVADLWDDLKVMLDSLAACCKDLGLSSAVRKQRFLK